MAALNGGARWSAAALLGILTLAAAIRCVRLESVPPGVFCDEAALALNAESLASRGRTLEGEVFPLYPKARSFEAWGVRGVVYQPVFQYAAIPFVRLLGARPAGIRLTSVVLGVLGVWAVFLLGRAMFGPAVGLAGAALMACVPWHVHFSRVGFEAIAWPTLLAAGAALLWTGPGRPVLLSCGAGVLAVATYAYPTAKLFVPILLIAFVAVRWRDLRASGTSALLAPTVTLLLLVLPNLWLVLVGTGQERVGNLLVWSASLEGERATRFLQEQGGWGARVLGAGAVRVPFTILYNFIQVLSPSFLFLDGDPNPRHGVPGMGLLSLTWLPLMGLGLFRLFRGREPAHVFLGLWLALFPLPSAITIEAPHAIRSIHGIPALAILAAVGGVTLFEAMGRRPVARRLVAAAALLLFAGETAIYLRRYHRDYPKRASEAWQAGLGEALAYARSRLADGEKVFVTARPLNSFLLTVFYGLPDLARLRLSPDPAESVRDTPYRILLPGAGEREAPEDWFVLEPAELEGRPRLRRIHEVRDPEGRTRFVVARQAQAPR